MNSQRLMVALLFALLCSGTLTWQFSRRLHPALPAARPIPLLNIAVASRNLNAGEKLSASALTSRAVAAANVFPGFLHQSQELEGRVLAVPVSAGEPILAHELVESSSQSEPNALVPNGMRLVAIPSVDPSAAELLIPGNHIDVFVTYRTSAEGAFVTSLVLQNIAVQKTEAHEDPTSSVRRPSDGVGLLVTPGEAATLTAANALGKLTFALRNHRDLAVHPELSRATFDTRADMNHHDGVARAPRVASRPETKTFVVETLAGGKSTIQTFEGTER